MIVAALLAVAAAGLVEIARRRGRPADEFFHAPPGESWAATAASLFSSIFWISWVILLSLGVDCTSGAWIIAGTGISLGIIGATSFVGRHGREGEMFSVTGALVPQRGSLAGFAIAAVLLASTLLLWIPLTLMMGSKVLNAITGWDLMTCGLLIIVVPGLLTIAGGQVAVKSMQIAAAVVVILGLVPLALTGGTVDLRPADLPGGSGQVHWVLLLAGAGLNTFWLVRGDFAASLQIRSSSGFPALRKAGLMAALLVILTAGALVFSGQARDAAGQEGTRLADGVVAAAILALAMASLSGYVMGASTLITVDLSRMIHRRIRPRAVILTGRLVASVTLIVSILAMSFVSLVSTSGVFNLLSVVAVVLAPVGTSAVLGTLLQRGRGGRIAAATTAGVAAAACTLWVRPWGSNDPESILVASLTGMVMVAIVMSLPARSDHAAMDAHTAQGFAGVQK